MHLAFWLTTASLSPLLIHQGRKARRDTPRLPEATGDCHGQYGDGIPERRLLVIGESTAAGVGVQRHEQGLASQLARLLHERSGKTVAWHTFGINGATLSELMDNLSPDTLPEAARSRVRFEHAQTIHPDDLQRMEGRFASMQPLHQTSHIAGRR